MPLNPFENLPASFTRQNFTANKLLENLKEIRINEKLKEGRSDDYVKIASNENLDNICKLSKHTEVSLSIIQNHSVSSNLLMHETCGNSYRYFIS